MTISFHNIIVKKIKSLYNILNSMLIGMASSLILSQNQTFIAIINLVVQFYKQPGNNVYIFVNIWTGFFTLLDPIDVCK